MRRIIKIHNSNKHLEFKSDEKYFDAGVERESSEIGSWNSNRGIRTTERFITAPQREELF